MDRKICRTGSNGTAVTKVVTLLLIICLVECVTEQRINNRGSKSSNVIDKVNGWRSQRGGSCLSYGHSCWGAHGKRSGKPPVTAPDWYLSRLLHRVAANAELSRIKQMTTNNGDLTAIYRLDLEDDAPVTNKLISDVNESPVEVLNRSPEAKPMLDDDMLSKMKIWQIMRESSEDN